MRGTPLSRKSTYLLVDRSFIEIVGSTNIGTGITPIDNTKPQISEGSPVFNFNC